MSKHTPGPWAIRRSASNGYPSQIFAPGADPFKPGGICDITRKMAISFPSSEEGEANARLIAAAPDLYEALKDARNIVFLYGRASNVTPLVSRIDDLIRRVEGNE